MTVSDSVSQLEFAWSAAPKWPNAASSDLVGVAVRKNGSSVAIMIDVQGSGSTGNGLAHTLLRFALDIAESGVSEELVAQAANQHLYAVREGRVSAAVQVISLDWNTREMKLCGFGDCVIGQYSHGDWATRLFRAAGAGTSRAVPPHTMTMAIEPDDQIIFANDGIARDEDGLRSCLPDNSHPTRGAGLADHIVRAAIERDGGRTRSDMAVTVISLTAQPDGHRMASGSLILPLRTHRSAI